MVIFSLSSKLLTLSTEYERASDKLGNTCTDHWYDLFDKRPSPYFDILSEVFGDLPMVCVLLGVGL
jgi:hypothetical protein